MTETTTTNTELCEFSRAWIGSCKNPKPCEEHANSKCCSCGAPAIKECYETMGPMVCGAWLCGECEHTIWPCGCNGPLDSAEKLPEDMKGHVKRTEQRFLPWYQREERTTSNLEVEGVHLRW